MPNEFRLTTKQHRREHEAEMRRRDNVDGQRDQGRRQSRTGRIDVPCPTCGDYDWNVFVSDTDQLRVGCDCGFNIRAHNLGKIAP